MFFFFRPLPQLIQDAVACRDNIMEAVEVVKRDPEVQHWKVHFDGYAEDAARLKGEYKDLFKIELASLMKRFVGDQKKEGEPSEPELLLHTSALLTRQQQPPQHPQPPPPTVMNPRLQPPLLQQTFQPGPHQPYQYPIPSPRPPVQQSPQMPGPHQQPQPYVDPNFQHLTPIQYATLTDVLRPRSSTPGITSQDSSFSSLLYNLSSPSTPTTTATQASIQPTQPSTQPPTNPP